METLEIDPKLALAEDIARFYDNPLGFVLYVFPWGKPGLLEHHDGPDTWQADALRRLGQEVRARKFDGVHPVAPIKLAVPSGHGTGKSVFAAWVTLWIMATRPHSRGIVTASTFQQLSTRSWSTLTQWLKASVIADWFEISSDRLWFEGSKESWFCVAQTAAEQASESFAGIHASGASPFIIFDESSGVPDKIYEVAQGATTDGEPFVVALGNPTKNSGWFYEACFGRDRENWIRFQVDSRTSKLTNKKMLDEWIQREGGLDSPIVRVRILGLAPESSLTQFISTEAVRACLEYKAESFENMPIILGVDVARNPNGDRSVILSRQGRKVRVLGVYRGVDTTQLAHKVADFIQELKPATGVIDGTGMGAGTVDVLRHMGYGSKVTEFLGGSKAFKPEAHANARSESWDKMRKALPSGLELPSGYDWISDLCTTEYFFNNRGAIQLESKDSLKARGADSPDLADALSMTFAVEPQAPKRYEPPPRYVTWPGSNSNFWMAS